MRQPKLDVEIDDSFNAILIVECPECGFKSRFALDETPSGTSVLCNCGIVYTLTGDNLESIKQRLEDHKKKLDKS